MDDESTYNTDYWGAKYHDPYLVVPGTVPGDDESLWWGNFIMKAGDVAKASGNLDTANAKTDLPIIKNIADLTRNNVVTVRLIDSVTGGTIYEKNVNVVA